MILSPRSTLGALARKYNRPVPRYTSYPTALRFEPIESEEQRDMLLVDTEQATGPLSLYVHLPFCASLCWFCGCAKIISTDPKRIDRYLDYLEREIDLMKSWVQESREVVQIHFGGGTPNTLSPAQIKRLNRILRTRFKVANDAEISVELDPRALTEEKVVEFGRLGMNRASIGVQDVNPDVQKAVHRIQPSEINRRALEWLRDSGVRDLNVDLIYGLPHQTLDTIADTLAEALDYSPSRIATFSYAHVPWSKPAQSLLEGGNMPTADRKIDIFEYIVETLQARGYTHIGMDHFAKPTDSMAVAQKEKTLQRNFQGYSLQADVEILSFGLSSISQGEITYRQNSKDLDEYYSMIDSGRIPIKKGYALSDDDDIRRRVIMRLMCDMSLGYDDMSARIDLDFLSYFNSEMLALESLEADGLVEIGSESIEVTPVGRLLIRNIAVVFDRYSYSNEKRYSQSV